MKFLLSISLLLLSFAVAKAVSLPAIFGDHMVLQQNSEVTIWGFGKPLEEIIVTASWDNTALKIVANSNATWSVKLKTPAAGSGSQTLTIKGYNTITLSDVLLGEVWLCSGQSNMEWSPRAGIENMDQIEKANHPKIRIFSVGHRTAENPQIDLAGNWAVTTPESIMGLALSPIFSEENYKKTLMFR